MYLQRVETRVHEVYVSKVYMSEVHGYPNNRIYLALKRRVRVPDQQSDSLEPLLVNQTSLPLDTTCTNPSNLSNLD